MKHLYALCSIVLAVFVCQCGIAQHSIYIKPYLAGLTPLGQPEFTESGAGYFPFEYHKDPHYEGGLTSGVILKDKFLVGFGMSKKRTTAEYSFDIYHSHDNPIPIESESNIISYTMLGYHLELGYRISERLSVLTKFEFHKTRSKRRLEYNSYITASIDEVNDELHLFLLQKDELHNPSGGVTYFESKIEYRILNNLTMYVGIQKSLSLNYNLYELYIDGDNRDHFHEDNTLPADFIFNDITISEDYFGLVLGVSTPIEIFAFGKEMKGTKVRDRLFPSFH